MIAAQLGQGKFIASAATTIIEGWLEGRSAFESLQNHNQLQNIVYITPDVKEPHLPSINLVHANNSINQGDSNSVPVANSIAYTMPGLEVALNSEHDSFNGSDESNNRQIENSLSGSASLALPNVQFVSQEATTNFRPVVDPIENRISSREQITVLSNEQLRQQYLRLHDELGAIQTIVDTARTGNLQQAINFLSTNRALMARLALTDNKLVKEIERRRALSQQHLNTIRPILNPQSESMTVAAFEDKLHKVLTEVELDDREEQELLHDAFKERRIEIPNPPLSHIASIAPSTTQQPMQPINPNSASGVSNTGTTSPNISLTSTPVTPSQYFAPSAMRFMTPIGDADLPDYSKRTIGTPTTNTNQTINSKFGSINPNDLDVDNLPSIAGSAPDESYQETESHTIEEQTLAKLVKYLSLGRIDFAKQVTDLKILTKEDLATTEVRDADRIAVLDQPFDDRGRERGGYLVIAAARSRRGRGRCRRDSGARPGRGRMAAGSPEGPGQRRDQQPPLGRVAVGMAVARARPAARGRRPGRPAS